MTEAPRGGVFDRLISGHRKHQSLQPAPRALGLRVWPRACESVYAIVRLHITDCGRSTSQITAVQFVKFLVLFHCSFTLANQKILNGGGKTMCQPVVIYRKCTLIQSESIKGRPSPPTAPFESATVSSRRITATA